jgi:(p)ppGpp synthase/HD superfamily hydrolase
MRPIEVTEEWLWQKRLSPSLSYLPPPELTKVREALSLAYDAHHGQLRKSGEPFITHPVEVTRILAELQMDYESLVAGLLHDTVEDCGDAVGLEEIEFSFGLAVRRIVEGETKFSKLPTHHPEREKQAAESSSSSSSSPSSSSSSPSSTMPIDPKAQDLQFLFLAMTEEVRIIVVKLADRLHNMRTMASMPPGKQRRIAQETLTVFAPLARLLGLYTVKEELEELSFMYAMPAQYSLMRKAVDKLWQQQLPVLRAARQDLLTRLEGDAYLIQSASIDSISVDVTRKALYPLWRKLQEAGRSIKDVSEISQLRVIIQPHKISSSNNDGNGNGNNIVGAPTNLLGSGSNNDGNGIGNGNGNGSLPPSPPPLPLPIASATEKQLCYHVMGVIHSFWAPIPGGVKDYIATPKSNNYQSLHTSVLPTGLSVEGGRAPRGGIGLFPVEIQIKTYEMNRLAEYGIAAESWSCADFNTSTSTNSSYGTTGTGTGTHGAALSNGNAHGVAKPKTSSNGSMNGSSNGHLISSNENGNGNGSSSSSSDVYGGMDPSNFIMPMLPWGLDAYLHLPPTSSIPSSSSSSFSSSSSSSSPSPSSANTTISASGMKLDPGAMSRRINWLNSIRQWQQEFVGTLTAQEFVDCITDDILGQGVFVFTPSGQVTRLPKGATVVDFAYHIHTDIGNTMIAAKVNGKVVPVHYELANAEVVEVITYKGPVNATMIKRHAQWLECAKTKSARHKIAKFLKEHAAMAASKGLDLVPPPTGGEMCTSTIVAGEVDCQVTWLVINCNDRAGLLADVANVIAKHSHNICVYSGSSDVDAGLFVMEYELEGPSRKLEDMVDDISNIQGVQTWTSGCTLPLWKRKKMPPKA